MSSAVMRSQGARAPAALPRKNHLLPLMVTVGAAYDEAGVCVYHEDGFFGGITVSSFRFGQVGTD